MSHRDLEQNDHLAYLDRCQGMTFDQLRRFIDTALTKRVRSVGNTEDDVPQSEEEFLFLCDMLKEKAAELKDDAPVPLPERPMYNGPPAPGSFRPSYDLISLQKQWDRCDRRLNDAIRDGSSTNYIDYIENELAQMERKVDSLERKEKQK